MKQFLNIIIKLGSIDRRYIFILVGLSVLIPLIRPIDIPIRATSQSQDVFNALDLQPNLRFIQCQWEYSENYFLTGIKSMQLRYGRMGYLCQLKPLIKPKKNFHLNMV